MSGADMDEVWKPVPSILGLEASSLGRIRRQEIERRMPHGGVRTYVGLPTYGCVGKAHTSANHTYRIYRYRTLGTIKIALMSG